MTFLEECIQDSLPVWERCLNTPFVRGIGDGTLDEACFKGYIVDDSLYLREYTKVFAWGILHSHDMDEIRSYYSLLAFIRESEDRTRQYYLERYQLTDREIQPLPLRVENQAYVDYMIAAAREGQGAAECMMACLPCMLSYGWIFGELIRRSPGVKDTPYWPFVRDYAGNQYETVCEQWADFTNAVCQDLEPERKERCREIFYQCSVHELHFWEMSARPRDDL